MTKVLVIEDELALREEIVTWLMFENYEVRAAADGVLGVEAALQDLPDLILSDINMPNLDGFGVLHALNANPATHGIPFVFISARGNLMEVREGMNAGADDYISKPFTRNELLNAIDARLRRRGHEWSVRPQ